VWTHNGSYQIMQWGISHKPDPLKYFFDINSIRDGLKAIPEELLNVAKTLLLDAKKYVKFWVSWLHYHLTNELKLQIYYDCM